MARMTKADIIEAVYEKVGGFSKKEAAEIVETVFNVVKETLERGEKIKISGFGNFVVRDKKDRMGRDPQRAVPILIPARRVLTFKPSQVLKNILNALPPVCSVVFVLVLLLESVSVLSRAPIWIAVPEWNELARMKINRNS